MYSVTQMEIMYNVRMVRRVNTVWNDLSRSPSGRREFASIVDCLIKLLSEVRNQ